MTLVSEMMRAQRLRYAVLREIDRQSVTIREDAIDILVETAMKNIDGCYSNEDDRGVQAEVAEKSINPIISGLVSSGGADITRSRCMEFLENPSPRLFPWSDARPGG
ncbi:MAG: hypothetical protein ABJN26_09915 [Stappiaceae bacterium]